MAADKPPKKITKKKSTTAAATKARIKAIKSRIRKTVKSTNKASTSKKAIKRKAAKKRTRKYTPGKTGHYFTGTHYSEKCERPIKYKSSWELTACEYLDISDDVVSYEYETIVIPYITSPRSNRIRKYFPDLIIRYSNGTTKMIEIKPERKLNHKYVIKKAEAARAWCSKHGMKYEFWTERNIRKFKSVLNEHRKSLSSTLEHDDEDKDNQGS